MPEPEDPTPDEVPPPPAAPGFDWSRPPDAQQPYQTPTGSTGSVGGLIPASNPKALFAYYCGVFALIPCLGFILGPIAAILGFLGLKEIERNGTLPGKVHAWIGISLGGLVFLAHAVLLVLILVNAKPSP